MAQLHKAHELNNRHSPRSCYRHFMRIGSPNIQLSHQYLLDKIHNSCFKYFHNKVWLIGKCIYLVLFQIYTASTVDTIRTPGVRNININGTMLKSMFLKNISLVICCHIPFSQYNFFNLKLLPQLICKSGSLVSKYVVSE